MNKWRAVAGATTIAALTAAVLAVSPAGAQEPPPDETLLPISVKPATVHPGETVTISGEGCVSDSGPGDLIVFLFSPGDEENPFDEIPADSVDDNGAWTLELTATEDDAGITIFTATCFVSEESDDVIADYDQGQVEVIVPEASTTTTTAPPVTTPPAVPAAPPAVVVSATPTFTG